MLKMPGGWSGDVPDASRKRKIRDHRDLRVWRKAQRLAQECRDAATTIPPTHASLAGVIRRLAEEVPNEIATGQGTGHHAAYVDHLERARRALQHLERRMIDAHTRKCVPAEIGDPLLVMVAEIGRMLRKLMVSLELASARRRA
jgi:four helix bundle protein